MMDFLKKLLSSLFGKKETNTTAPVTKTTPTEVKTVASFDLLPSAIQNVVPGQTIQFKGTGGTPPYKYKISSNFSGATISASGLYKAGSKYGGQDDVLGTDSKGAKSYTAIKVNKAASTPAPTPAPTPVPTPTPAPTSSKVGAVTGFNPKPDSTIMIDGHPYEVNTPGKPYSMTLPDTYTLRFELRSGDRYCTSNYCDDAASERSEVSDYKDAYKAGTTWRFQYDFLVEAGSAVTSPWLLVGQLHDVGPGGSPPFSIEIMPGDKLAFQIGWLKTNKSTVKSIWDTTLEGKSISYGWAWIDPNKITRGKWYKFDVSIKLHPTDGKLTFLRDGTQVFEYTGPLGFGYSNKWEYGIYRNSSKETLAVQYRNMHFTNS